jgi:hypothetical protein
MKKNLYLLLPIFTAILSILMVTGNAYAYYPGGAPAGYTGSPGDGQNCTSCHGGSASTVSGWITSNIPAAGYTAGTAYTITVSVTGSTSLRKGFEVSPQNIGGTLLGTLTAGSGNHTTGSGKYVTHSSGSYSNPATWSFTWTAPVAGTGTVTFYGAFCVGEPTTKLSTLVVNEYLPLTANATANPMTIYQGQTSQLNVTATGGSGTYTYSWTSNPAGFTSSQQNPVVSPTVTTTYTATVNDGTNNANSSVTVTVNPALPLSVTASANPSSIAAGQQSQLTATASGGTWNYTYSWVSNPAGFTSNIPSPVVQPTVTTQYTVTVNDGSTNASASTTVTVTALPLTVDVTASPQTLCAGQTTQLNAATSGGSGTYAYSWTSVPPGFTASIQNPQVQPTVTTKYFCLVNDGTTNVNDSVQVVVNPLPSAYAGNDTTYCVTITQIPLSGTATNNASVQWSTSGDGTFSSTTSLSTIYYPGTGDKTTGSVNLILTATPVAPCPGNAVSTKHITFDPCNGVPVLTGNSFSVVISPNPSHGVFSISAGVSPTAGKVTVSDTRGKVVVTEMLPASGNLNFDMSDLPKGMYFLTVRNETGTVTRKLIIE